jgi:hypothetical protein
MLIRANMHRTIYKNYVKKAADYHGTTVILPATRGMRTAFPMHRQYDVLV